MAFSYDPTTDAGRVRLLVADTDPSPDVFIFQDDEIEAFLSDDISGGNILVAAAFALETVAVDTLKTIKVIQMLDLKTDGAAVARAARQQASEWRAQAADGEGLDFFQVINSPWAKQDYLYGLRVAEGV